MARNGSGTYSNPYPNFVSGTVISSSQVDANNSDVATALTQSIAVDGQSVVTANIPLTTHKLTAVSPGSASTDSLNLGQAQAEAFVWCGTAGGSANAITLSPSPAITAYAAGQRFVWMASGSVNTGATTVAISGLGAIALQDNGVALVAGNHAASKMFMGILNTTGTMQIMQVQSSGTDPLIVSSLTVSGTSVLTGVTTHGDDVVSDTDSTDDLGTNSVRWANLFVDGITATDQVTATGFTGTLDGILGSGAPAAATVTTLTASGIASIDDTTDTTSGTTGSIHTDGGVGVAKALFVGTTSKLVGVTTHGGNVVSDTDSTDDLGTTGVRWANLYVDAITATDQITATGFTGTLDGILGSGAPAAATVTTLVTSGIVSVDDTTTSTSGTTGSIHTDGGLGVAGAAFVAGAAKIVGVTTHGGNVVSDTDSTDDLGTTGVRWANLFVDAITATDQITATGFTGTLDGILGSGAAAAANVTTLGSTAAITGGTIVLAATDTDTSNTGSVTIDFSAHQNFVLTLTGNVTLANPSTEAVGQAGVFVFIQDGTGSRTLSLGTDYESPASGGITLSTAAAAVDVVPYFVKASGSIQLGAPQLAFG